MARENSGWGYTRILGELRKLKIKTSRSNVVNILRTNGHDPKTDPTKGTWAEFLRAHAETLWQCDFFWKYASGPDGLLRKCMALTFVHVSSRRVWISPCTFHPTQMWVGQQAKAFIDHKPEVGAPLPLVMRDNDQLYRNFDETLQSAGARVHHLAFRSPNTNAYVERFVQSVKQECLDHFALCDPEHMDHLIREYLDYYHHERPHQSKGNEPLSHAEPELPAEGDVLCRERLGGLLRHYYREAAA